MIRVIFFFNIFLFFIFLNKSYANLENSIIVKVDKQIITNFEIKNKILTTLVLSNKEINQENIDNLKSQALESLIQLKLKFIELSKYDFEISNIQLEQYLYSNFSTDINSLKKKFDNNGLDFDLFIEELKVGLKWQQFIFSRYSKKMNIDSLQVENELKDLIKIDENLKEYNLSEIELVVDENENLKDKIEYINQQVNSIGFDQVAFNLSISSSASNNGDIGWVNAKSLSKEIFEILDEMEIGQISRPIIIENNILFLKINKIRTKKLDNDNIIKLKKDIINQKKNELLNLFSKSHISKLKNNSFIEYK
tara:strand:- start:1495 stop:2421 length:927 start_codon:yes stop_codon:yes gene_type:complete